MMAKYPTLYERIELLMLQRRERTLQWLDMYNIQQKHVIQNTHMTKSLMNKYVNWGKFKPWMITAVEQSIMDLLDVGPNRYIYYSNYEISYNNLIRMLDLPASQVILDWQEPSNTKLCVPLKLI